MFDYLKRKVLSNRKLRKAIIRVLRQQQLSTFSIHKFTVYDSFRKDNGRDIDLYKGLRSFVNPDWEKMFQAQKDTADIPFDADIDLLTKESMLYFLYFEKVLMSYDISMQGRKLLEIGAGNMLLSCLMAKKYPDTEIVASGVDSYYDDLGKGAAIQEARKKVMNHFGVSLPYVADSITSSSFEDASFDVLFSNTVLEHVDDINACFNEMKRILKPGGIGFHFYNPFFSYNGGHTSCSTDHPWGHCVLSEAEYLRYLKEKDAANVDISITFYRNDLNKKSLKEFRDALAAAGFSQYSMIPETNFNVSQLLLPFTLQETRQHYPLITLEDLLTNSVLVVFQK